jgi:hypothetical protein
MWHLIEMQPPTSLTLVSPTNSGGLGANVWYKTVVRRISGAGNIRVERELSEMVATSCSRLNQSKPLMRRRNSRIQHYCRQYASALPLSNPRIVRSVMHYYLQYRYMIRVAERHVCSEPGRAKKCSYLEFPTATRVPCAPSKTLWISTSFTLGWPWCHS